MSPAWLKTPTVASRAVTGDADVRDAGRVIEVRVHPGSSPLIYMVAVDVVRELHRAHALRRLVLARHRHPVTATPAGALNEHNNDSRKSARHRSSIQGVEMWHRSLPIYGVPFAIRVARRNHPRSRSWHVSTRGQGSLDGYCDATRVTPRECECAVAHRATTPG